ncbi:MAG: malic enzyme-like NAD(P)-binding protein [Thioalkalispiraceae bacterium]|jgi:malate dehydrogenase (oxaloacetate-decarboxylating)(NADP+)
MAEEKDSNEEKVQAALTYHAKPIPGKIGTLLTKPCETQEELSLAYTPGVAAPVRAIVTDPIEAYNYTAKGNTVAVITDGSAVLGLGNVGALAAKPVMEGKGVLFKRFADIDVIDLEVTCDSPDDFIETVVNVSSGFGGINLEDIGAPHCFYIEKALKERLDIPVFHDDQHGTAIIVSAGLINALELQAKELSSVKIVCLGAGAAALASMQLLLKLGAQLENIRMVDRKGVIRQGREGLNEYKALFAGEFTEATLEEAMQGADVLVGVSGPNLVSSNMVESMAEKPVVFALSNPDPEISPDHAFALRDDLLMATGRSDYPNQVNNVLGFPFIFRGALDVRATTINTEMQIAAVHALARLAHAPVPQQVLSAYQKQQGTLYFGPEYIIPTPFDPRLKDYVATAVAKAAVDSGVAQASYPNHYPPIATD